MDESTVIHDLMTAAARLITIMNRETDLLANAEPQRIHEVQNEKGELTRRLVGLAAVLRRDPTVLAAVSAAARDEIRDALSRFDEAARANERALAAAREANQRILATVAQLAPTQRSAVPLYSRKAPEAAGARKVAEALPLVVNQAV